MFIEFIKNLIRPVYFLIFRLRGYPGVTLEQLKIIGIENEYGDVYTFELEKPTDFHFSSGQYAHIVAPNGYINNHDVRDMSFATAPHEQSIKLTMDLSSNSRFKRKFRGATLGDLVGIYAVKGNFGHTHKTSSQRRIYIAGGVGITAIRSLILDNMSTSWHLIYAGKGYAYQQLWQSHANQVSKAKRDSLYPQIQRHIQPNNHYLVCGGESFVSSVRDFLLAQGVDAGDIEVEGFGGL